MLQKYFYGITVKAAKKRYSNEFIKYDLSPERGPQNGRTSTSKALGDPRVYYIGSAEGHEYPNLQVGDEVNPRRFLR